MKAFKSTLSLSGGQAQGYNKRHRRQDVTAENGPGYNGNRSYNQKETAITVICFSPEGG